MRIVVLIVVAATLGACGGPEQVAVSAEAKPVKSVMEAEAEKVCGEMTSFSADALEGKPLEMQAKLHREFDLCVTSVAGGEATPAKAPALRGRTAVP